MTDTLTPWGFTYGPAEITRLWSSEGRGRALEIKTPHAKLTVYISEQGRKIRVFDKDGREWGWPFRDNETVCDFDKGCRR
jgi:hypothetical protein